MSFNGFIMLIEHIAGFCQEVAAHLDDFVLTDIPGTLAQIGEYFTNFFGYLA